MTNIRTFGPIITNANHIDEDTSPNAILDITVAAELTGHTVGTLRKFRQVKKGPKSFVHNHKVRYRLQDVYDYNQNVYDSTLVTGDEATAK